ncbi:MAG: DUF4238 domain-containing protein [Chitinophagaceae bacterium]|jgi:hypothetical protein
MEPEYQKQHRVSQVYLKQFGFEKDNVWYVSVWKKYSEQTGLEVINDFTKEVNIFDLPYEEFKYRRHFENSSNILETAYPKVIKSIINQKQLIKSHQNILAQYVANLICRTKPFREFFDLLLTSGDTRKKFLNEICLFGSSIEEIEDQLKSLQGQEPLNVTIGYMMNHLVHILLQFNYVILKEFEGRGWMTSDNPVVLDKNENHSFIIPIEAEIYLPLSRDFCLFMYHSESANKTNPLRQFPVNRISELDDDLYKKIIDLIFKNENEFVIFPYEIEPTSLLV